MPHYKPILLLSDCQIHHSTIATSGTELPHCWGFTITLKTPPHTQQDFLGQVIRPMKGPLPNIQHSQQTDIHANGGIRTSTMSIKTATDQCLRPRGHWDWP